MARTTGETIGSHLVCPVDLTIEPLERMLNFEIVDDPHYTGLEIQWLDDPGHGTGMVVLMTRREDGRTDVYRQRGLRLDPGAYAIAGGLGRWEEAAFDPARLEVARDGVVAHVRFVDAEGRPIEVRIDDRDGRRRTPASMLAPLGAAVERPTSLMLVWMRLDLVRRGGREPEIRIDDRPAATGRLPGAWLHRRRLIKWATDLAVVRVNPDVDEAPVGPTADVETDAARVVAVSAEAGSHRARLALEPPLPDLGRLSDGESLEGSWRVDIDAEASIVGGTWTATRSGDRVDLAMDVTRGWRPRRLPPLMRVVTTMLRLFRTWPTTYRWTARVTLGEDPTISSRWERTGSARAEAYQRVTG